MDAEVGHECHQEQHEIRFCPVKRVKRDGPVRDRRMSGQEQKEREGHEGTGKSRDRNIKSVGEIHAGLIIGGICLSIVIVRLIGCVETDDHIVAVAVVRVIFRHQRRDTRKVGFEVRPDRKVVGVSGIVDISSHGHNVIVGHLRRVGMDLIDRIIF